MKCSQIPYKGALRDVKLGVWCAMTAARITALKVMRPLIHTDMARTFNITFSARITL